MQDYNRQTLVLSPISITTLLIMYFSSTNYLLNIYNSSVHVFFLCVLQPPEPSAIPATPGYESIKTFRPLLIPSND